MMDHRHVDGFANLIDTNRWSGCQPYLPGFLADVALNVQSRNDDRSLVRL